MSEISVELEAVSTAIKSCKSIQANLKATSIKILQQHEILGSGWKDEKYKEFGQIVHKCTDALKQPLSELQRCEVFLQKLYTAISEYESIHFGNLSNQGVGSSTGNGSNSLGASRGYSIFENIFNRDKNIYKALKGVEHRPIQSASIERTEQQIISDISGGDMTEGSCSSLAFAYVGNRAGYVVYDFRDGQSRNVFSSRSSIEQIANMQGVDSVIIHGRNDAESAERLMSDMERGREYYMATGRHAAIVRMNNDGYYQYLELQSEVPSNNGWHPLTQRALYERFGCEDGHDTEWSNYRISLDSLRNNTEFLNLLGYINTDESQQMRGEHGYVR